MLTGVLQERLSECVHVVVNEPVDKFLLKSVFQIRGIPPNKLCYVKRVDLGELRGGLVLDLSTKRPTAWKTVYAL